MRALMTALLVAIAGVAWCVYSIVECDAKCRSEGFDHSTAYVSGRCGCDNHAAMVQP